jgi:alpha-L-fucosidase
MEGTEQAVVEIDLNVERTFDIIVLKEHIQTGQRIEKFRLEYLHQDAWKTLCVGTVVGYKRICQFPKVTARHVRLTIEESRWYPTLSAFEVYSSPRG